MTCKYCSNADVVYFFRGFGELEIYGIYHKFVLANAVVFVGRVVLRDNGNVIRQKLLASKRCQTCGCVKRHNSLLTSCVNLSEEANEVLRMRFGLQNRCVVE